MSALLALLALSVVALVFPLFVERYQRKAKNRRAHDGGVSHWYTNFDTSLEYEPRHKVDIDKVSLEELRERGYRPTGVPHRIPRTFRSKIPGDSSMQLWRSADKDAATYWVCTFIRKKN